jgi:hypothetical protein
MSTDHAGIATPRWAAGGWWLALLLALALASAVGAQEPAEPPPEDDVEAVPGVVEPLDDVDRVPATAPGEPEPPLEGEGEAVGGDPLDELGELEDAVEPGLGSFFQTSFALAAVHDRFDGFEPPGEPTTPLPPGAEIPEFATSDTGWLVRPSFLFVHRPSSRTGLVLAYEPEFEELDRGTEPDRMSHSAGIVFDHRASRRTELTAGASYLDTLDPSRHLGGDTFVLIPGRFEQERIYAGLSHRWLRATHLHLYGEYSTAKNELESELVPLELSDLSGTVALERDLGRRSELMLTYSYLDSELETLDLQLPELPAPARFSGPVQAVRIGFGHRPSARLSFHIASGVLREEDELTGEYDDSWIGSVEVAREGDVLALRLSLDRSLFSFGGGDAAVSTGLDGPVLPGTVLRDTLADTLSFHVDLHPPGRVRWEQSIWLARRTLLDSEDVDSLVTSSLVEVLLTGGNAARVGLFARFDYHDREESGLFGGSLSRERFTLGFRVGLSGPQTKLAQRIAIDELRKVLPSSGGRF